MPLSKKRNKARMRMARATQVQLEVVHPELDPVQPKEDLRPDDKVLPSRLGKTYSSLYLPSKQEKLTLLRELIANPDALQSTRSHTKEESNSKLPLYNKRLHGPGTRVIKDGREVIVPELDADGNIVPGI